ncbi:MAG: protein kinase, partial [Planctomycetota bacterium]
MFGHYEIRGMLGQGGFGTVYQAWDSELERFVALKIPRDRSRARANAQAFLREARAAASIVHPNIVSVFEVGIHDEPYLASQYIEGTTLRT